MNRAQRRAAARGRGPRRAIAITYSVDPDTGRRLVTEEIIGEDDDPRPAFERNMVRAEAHFDEWDAR